MTKSEQAFIDRADEYGHVWFVPAQVVMIRRLAARGVITIDEETRYNRLRGATERRATVRR